MIRMWRIKYRKKKEKRDFDDINKIESERKFNRTFATQGLLLTKIGPQLPDDSRANLRYEHDDDIKSHYRGKYQEERKMEIIMEESKYDA